MKKKERKNMETNNIMPGDVIDEEVENDFFQLIIDRRSVSFHRRDSIRIGKTCTFLVIDNIIYTINFALGLVYLTSVSLKNILSTLHS